MAVWGRWAGRGGSTVSGEEQNTGDDVLVYRGQTWRVESAPEVIESDGDHDLIEVWVRRGEGIEQPE
jgi:hypothetical protein